MIWVRDLATKAVSIHFSRNLIIAKPPAHPQDSEYLQDDREMANEGRKKGKAKMSFTSEPYHAGLTAHRRKTVQASTDPSPELI